MGQEGIIGRSIAEHEGINRLFFQMSLAQVITRSLADIAVKGFVKERRRIGEAQTLLVTTDLSITEVSARIGYDNISYFNNQFKKFTGLSPQSYRKYKVGMNQYKQLGEIAAQERRR